MIKDISFQDIKKYLNLNHPNILTIKVKNNKNYNIYYYINIYIYILM